MTALQVLGWVIGGGGFAYVLWCVATEDRSPTMRGGYDSGHYDSCNRHDDSASCGDNE